MESQNELPPKFGLADLNMTEDEEGYLLGKKVVMAYWKTAVSMTPAQCEQMLQHIRNKDFLIPRIIGSYAATRHPLQHLSHMQKKFGREAEKDKSEAYFEIYPEVRPKRTKDDADDDIKDGGTGDKGNGSDETTDDDELDAPLSKRQRLNEGLVTPEITLTVKNSTTVGLESAQASVAKTAEELRPPTADTWNFDAVIEPFVPSSKQGTLGGNDDKPGFSMRRRRQESLGNLAKEVTETRQLMKTLIENQDRMQLSLGGMQSTVKEMAENYHDNDQERRTNVEEIREYMKVMANAVKELRDDVQSCDY
ncbi:hypothetical protein TARUN_9275 [Trichoderma arundinaceum]|uniref:Uncharacterized protein n=1 Tax=Trichoderma arundinaceum TaxID=490622 RepID=A0A395NA53_TRIAR|nr:hypothetical protein TARUN_9275 [Trichoderma arundinaceum]